MSGWWLASYVVLWVVCAATLVVLLVVLRQMGFIYLRLRSGPGGVHVDDGPDVGARVSFEEVDDATGERYAVPDAARPLTLLVFASATCSLCKDVLVGLAPATRRRGVATVVVSAGERDANEPLRVMAGDGVRFTTSVDRQRALKVQSIPYAVVVDARGTVVAKGLVNSVHDLDDLLDRAERETRTADGALRG